MDALFEKLGWKKFAALVVGITILFLIILFVSFQPTNKPNEENNKANPESNSRLLDPNDTSSIPLTQTYSSEFYTVNYPENFELTTLTVTAPIVDSIKLKNPSLGEVSIAVFESDGTMLESLSLPYQNSNYTTKALDMNGLLGVYFEGGLPSLSLNEKVALVKKNNFIIRVLLSYGGVKNEKLEASFDAIVESLR